MTHTKKEFVMDLFDIKGKKAIVTGATRGLGYGMAEGLLEAGAEVVITGTSEKVFAVRDGFLEKGFHCHAVQGEFFEEEEVYRVFRECVEMLGGTLDIMVVNHGIQRRHRANEFPLSEFDDVIAVDLKAVFILDQEAARLMIPNHYGKIINVASMNSFFGGTEICAYTAAKGGVAQMTKALSNDLFGYGININAIAPGYMATDLTAVLREEGNPRYKEIMDRIPAGRWGTGEDMKGACIFLASHASDYVGGCILPVDGGYLVK